MSAQHHHGPRPQVESWSCALLDAAGDLGVFSRSMVSESAPPPRAARAPPREPLQRKGSDARSSGWRFHPGKLKHDQHLLAAHGVAGFRMVIPFGEVEARPTAPTSSTWPGLSRITIKSGEVETRNTNRSGSDRPTWSGW